MFTRVRERLRGERWYIQLKHVREYYPVYSVLPAVYRR